jgi:formylglycine-generating enzyme required for sulfatase activity
MPTRQSKPRVSPALALLALTLGGCGCQRRPAEDVAGHTGAPQPITTTSGVEMVLIPAGEFVMGDDRGEEDERPAHRVGLSAFYMDTCEVTQESFRQLTGRSPAKFKGPDRPVERVSWYDAAQYCNARSLREGLSPCYDRETLQCDFRVDGYRLPTEAEWEYACRAGTTTRWSFGSDPGKLGKHAWSKENAAKTTHPVRRKSPNPWGLYDMHGNVWEWCNDFFGERYQQSGPSKDPHGPVSGQERVLRGGSWASSGESCRSSARNNETPRFADACFGTEAYGFRCVRRATHGPTAGP